MSRQDNLMQCVAMAPTTTAISVQSAALPWEQ